MAKFNHKASTESKMIAVNKEGAKAFPLSSKSELFTRVASCLMGEGKFYDSQGAETREAIAKLVEAVAQSDPEFILKLASYARNELYLRSVPIFLLVEACKYPQTKAFVRKYAPSIIRRADELTETMAAWIQTFGPIGDGAGKGSMAAALKKGIADSFHN